MFLFVDISSHGFGHLSITAPVLRALAARVPKLRLTVRSLLPQTQLRQRIGFDFEHLPVATDFGFVMHDALRVDLEASAARYRQAEAEHERRLASEAALLRQMAPDLVLSNISDLPLAGAAEAGIPAAALCSLNWADLFRHCYGDADWAQPIHARLLAAYRSARMFLRTTPGMAMPDLANLVPVGPIAQPGRRIGLGLPSGERAIVLAMGGIAMRLPVEDWPRLPGIRWLVPQAWNCGHPDAIAQEFFGLPFPDLLASADAVVTKPGYGTFTEAACNGTPVLYQRRPTWLEQDVLIAWLEEHWNCGEVDGDTLQAGRLGAALERLWSQPAKPRPLANGDREAAAHLMTLA
ncbi:MAG: hypothetical protein ACM3SV_09095 [Betaproteobacteria bacterium]